MDVGFIGLGSMGHAMAANLLQAGHTLRVWNRSPDKADDLVARGAQRAGRPADCVSSDGLVVTMLSDDAALEAVVAGPDGIGERLAAGGIHISMSTIAPSTSSRLAALHVSRGAAYVAAPVFGRPDAAATKLLFVLMAGPQEACTRILPLLEAMGQKVFQIGQDPAQANIIKLGGNFMIMAAIEAMAETMTLGEKFGVAREKMMEVLTQSILPAPLFVNYGRQIANHSYEPARFKLSLGLKDANLVLAAAGSKQVPMPLAGMMQNRFLSSMAKGRGEFDWTAAALGVSEDAGSGSAA
ncbi:MAG TPA: NAD(P)-dependent oxidoreductase [Noviherbaspirillum sp.]|uniref:NAD(P)-dependent oxidoreductase n=1 Tax=Noviherbaspirillum sp. TaxID=1926288 RepID=UPI002B48E4BE|nr:NAD(P)-dependent oxidoreductase [Noviherbaspirillum sp.]HJV84106.1 NAD(P)-dependent oxidoreductase [Noviherbaspirillum sp.]